MIKDILRLGLILFGISALATGILAWVNQSTIKVITDRKIKEAAEARLAMMPGVKTFEEFKAADDTTFVYYIAKDSVGNVLGYNFTAAKRGYSSVVKTMVALDKEFNIIGMQVIDQNETPGLGTHSVDKDFPQRFIGKNADNLKVDKDGGPVKSITGATITTRAITNSLHDAILLIKDDLSLQKEAAGAKTEAGKPLSPAELKAAKVRQGLIPEAKSFVEKKAKADTSFVYYIATGADNQTLGYVVYGAKKGYCSLVRTACALDEDLKISKVEVLKQDETPGLGARCVESDFLGMFNGKNTANLKLDKEGGPIVAISGATITTRAFTQGIVNAINTLKTDLVATNGGVK